jgi:uncharacterized protein YqgC (DUF456 family)
MWETVLAVFIGAFLVTRIWGGSGEGSQGLTMWGAFRAVFGAIMGLFAAVVAIGLIFACVAEMPP